MRSGRLLSTLLVLLIFLVACGGAPAATPTAVPAASAVADAKPTFTPAAVPGSTEAPPVATSGPTTPPKPTDVPKPVISTLTVKLRAGTKWSDGTDLTTADFVGTYDILWAKKDGAWDFLRDVVAKDPTTLEFQITVASPRALRLFLRSYQAAPRSQYSKWMDQAHALRLKGADRDGDEVKALITDLEAFKPTEAVVYGPYKLDQNSITEAQITMVKNPTGFRADQLEFETMIVNYGKTAASVPLMLSGELDYSTHGYTPADVAAFEKLPNVQIVRGPTGTGPALWFNESVYPLGKKEVRQAFAYAIDRNENATVALGESGKPIKYMAGFSDLLVPLWLSPATIAKLNPYTKDLKKAEELLLGIGFKRGADNMWVDDKGTPLAFELSVPSDFADWSGATENASQQLNAFGIKTTVRGYQSSERAKTIKEAQYQILVDVGMRTNPAHPNSAYRSYMLEVTNNANNPEATSGSTGMNWPWQQTAPDGTTINIKEYVDKSVEGFDPEPQKKYIETLAQIYNDQLPVVPLFERYSNDPIDTTSRVTGWLPLDNKVYQNNQGSDNYIAIQLLDGVLKAAPTGDKSFRTSWPYPQPPNYDLHYFTENSLPQGVGSPAYNMMYPPLFWYMWADGEYVPVVAESYELKDVR